MFGARGLALASPHGLGRVSGGGFRGGGMRHGGGGFRPGGVRTIFHGGRNWWWNPTVSRWIIVGGGGYWPGYYGYGWPNYYGYGWPYQYPVAAHPVQQVQAPTPCPTNVRLSDADLDSIRRGQNIRLTGANQCGQAVDVTVGRMSSSQVSGLDGYAGYEQPPEPPPLGDDGGYGFTPVDALAGDYPMTPEAPAMGAEYAPAPLGHPAHDPYAEWRKWERP